MKAWVSDKISDVSEFINIAADINLKPEVKTYPFSKAKEALTDIKNCRINGAKIIIINE